MPAKTTRVLVYLVLAGALLEWAPGLEPLRWMPDDAMALVPKVFRPGDAADEDRPDPTLTEQVDDAVLVAMGPGGTAPAVVVEDLVGVGDGTAEVILDEGDEEDEAEDEPGPTVDSNLVLPPEPEVRTTPQGLPLLAIEDPQGGMRRFYESLDRAQRGDVDGIARVLHYGDSLITGDYVTSTLRRLMQKKFGDAGHGFVLAGRPAPWYGRDNLSLRTSGGWDVFRLTRPTVQDGMYGLGGATFATRGAGDWVRVEPNGEAPIGNAVSKFQAFYLAQPGGGQFQMGVDGRTVKVDTRSDEEGSRLAEILVEEDHHTFELKTLGRGEVRLFGVVLERDGPGIVYDSLGMDGARAKLLKRMKPEHWHDQIRLRRPDLIVLHYGTNESQAANLGARRYKADLSETVGHIRAALPGVSCLLVGPMDRAEKGPSGKLVTREVVKRIVQVQREVAYAQGCAFYNTWRAMGGEGSMARWYRAKPPLAGGDLTHPTRLGAERIGQMLFLALMDGYQRHRGQ